MFFLAFDSLGVANKHGVCCPRFTSGLSLWGCDTGQLGQRRSERILLDVPVVIRGEAANQGAFLEETFTVTISAHGALVMLGAGVILGQKVTVRNTLNQQEQEARIAYTGTSYAGLAKVGLEFVREAPDFWPLTSPPAASVIV
jgi:hypothetical protein